MAKRIHPLAETSARTGAGPDADPGAAASAASASEAGERWLRQVLDAAASAPVDVGGTDAPMQDAQPARIDPSAIVVTAAGSQATPGLPTPSGTHPLVLPSHPVAAAVASPLISVADIVVGEGDGIAYVTVSLNAPGLNAVSVNYATAAATAASGSDFTSTSGTLNFAVGETSKVVEIVLGNGTTVEALEHLRLNLSAPVNATIAKASAMVGIVDNDTVVPAPGIYVRDVVVDEKAGTASFVVMLGGPGGQASASTVTVDYASAVGSAAAADFGAKTGSLTFDPGETVKTVTVAITDDAVAEGAERFLLNLSNAVNAVIVDGRGVATIGASDAAAAVAPTLSVADMIVGEGDGYVDVVVSLNAPSASAVSVAYATQETGTCYTGYDFTAVTGTLNFAAGETTKVVRIELEGSGSYDSGALEHFRFNLSGAVNATIAKASAMVSIVDNDLALGVGEQPGLYVRDVVVDEKAGTATYVVLLGGVNGVANAGTVTVDYAVAGGNATSGSDYNGNADALSGKLTFGPGETVKTVTVAISDDAVAEGAERFLLNLSNAVNAVIVDGQGVATIGASDAAAAVAPTLSVADMIVGEGDGYVDVVVSLNAPSASAVSVAYATQETGTCYTGYDFMAVTGTLNFAAGETTKVVRIELEGSGSYDSGTLEHFRFNLSAPTNATLAKASGMISIVDNDTALGVGEQPELYVRDVVIDEKAGTATFVVLLGGPTGVANASMVTVDYAVASGNATSGSDYNANADALTGKLTFAPGEVVKTVTLAITDDAVAEGAERILLNLSNAVNATIVDGQGVATIGANDGATSAAPTLSVADMVVGEGDGYVDVLVSLNAPSASAVSVAYARQEVGTCYDGYDFQPVSGTLNFAAGETTKTVRIQLEGSGSYDSGTLEHFRFNLSAPTNATLAKASGMISIVDNDTALGVGEQPKLYVRDVVIDEKAGTATFVVLLGGPTGVKTDSTVTVDYAVAGGSASSGSDYNANADALSGKLTFGPGEVVRTVTVAINDDAAAEGAERINLSLSNAVNAVIVDGNGVAVVGAGDGAAAPSPTLSVANKTVSESDGYIDMVVSLSAASASNVSVAYATQEVAPAYNGYDFQPVSGTLNFAAGETTKVVRIQLEGSGSYDTAGVVETFRLNLSAAVNATIATPTATITIIDDDLAGQKVFSYGISDDVYTITSATDVIVENVDGGTDLVNSAIDYTLGPTLENLTLTGAAITGTGNALDNVLIGNANANTLTGLAGNDTLDGMAGADTMVGGTGDDTYKVDVAGDVVTEIAGEGTDTVLSTISYTLASPLENLTLLGGANINGTGNASANILLGNSGNNTLDGKAGADTMAGAAGNDTYVVDTAGDTVAEAAGEGADTVRSSISYTLGANLENLVLLGGGNINGTGNGAVNTITGNSGNNKLDGKGGADAMIGGLGDDTYTVDVLGDAVTEAAGEGTDLVLAGLSFTLAANVENLTLTGGAHIDGTGNDLANVITGNSGVNVLDGKAGADSMIGGAGNDFYVVDAAGDTVIEAAGEGTDELRSYISIALPDNVENLVLLGNADIDGTGSAVDNIITGNDGANTLDGQGGADAMGGGGGNDTYVVDDAGDTVTEGAGGGTSDLVQSSVTFVLGAEVEKLTLTGAAAINATGNGLVNVLIGNTANNQLDGKAGADTMKGGKGNDTYIVDNAGDVVSELAGQGSDLVKASVSFVLSAEVEKLTLTGAAATTGTGNGLANLLTGNGGDNVLDGLAGADAMAGGGGNDTYVVDDAGDTVTEAAGEGADTLRSSIAITLPDNVENLVLLGSAHIGATGNALANAITGNSGNNLLDGLDGGDAMHGGAGNDTYVVNEASDTVFESAGEGTDLVKSVVSFTLGADVENLTLEGGGLIDGTGNELSNILVGNAANNVLDGRSGADAMSGGAGNDTYIVDHTGDTVGELVNEGVDLVQSSVSFVLGNDIEKLTLTGASAIDGTGNNKNNTLTGNTAANTLDGKAGADVMKGGKGNDVYVVDNAGDAVTELAGQGTADQIRSKISFTLAAEVENLRLIGSDAIDGTGNVLDNLFYGNVAANRFTGDAGHDTFVIDGLLASDTITDFVVGTDRLQVGMAAIPVGDGDKLVEGAVVSAGPGGFDASAEYVVMTSDVVGVIDATAASAAIGSAFGAYAVGQKALFMVDNGVDSALYYFNALDADAAVEANELTLLATLQGTASTGTADLIFGA